MRIIEKAWKRILKIAVMLFFIIFSITILFPIIWMLFTGLKTDTELFTSPWSLPKALSFVNYIKVWTECIGGNFLNSVFFTITSTFFVVIISGFAAYAVCRFKFKIRFAVFLFIISGLMLAPQVSLIPLYKMLNAMNLYDTRTGLLLSYIAFRIPFSFFLIWTYFTTLPIEVEEAAFIDGCGVLRTFFKIVMPMSKPVIVSTAVMCARYVWNDFMFALVFTESDALKTIPVGLYALRSSSRTQWTELLAGLAISALPIMLAFVFLQKYFINGMNDGSVKG